MKLLSQASSMDVGIDEIEIRGAVPFGLEAEMLTLRLERAVRRATSDRVRNLQVEIQRGAVYLMGDCATYHCKQIAQTVAMATAGREVTLHNQIQVW